MSAWNRGLIAFDIMDDEPLWNFELDPERDFDQEFSYLKRLVLTHKVNWQTWQAGIE